MTKEEYLEWLSHPRWIEKRTIVLERDSYSCQKCRSKKNLHVHHQYYITDSKPWEVPDDCLVTLCEVCHRREHNIKVIKSVGRPKKRKKSLTQESKSDYSWLSEKDKKIQARYEESRMKGALPPPPPVKIDDHSIKIKLRNEESNKLRKAQIRKRRK